MHCAVIEFARNVCGMDRANSSEFAPDTPYPVIDLMPEQRHVEELGGTMRLGSILACWRLTPSAHEAYGKLEVNERHRHRYEVSNAYERFSRKTECP
jgi:CTP synthase